MALAAASRQWTNVKRVSLLPPQPSDSHKHLGSAGSKRRSAIENIVTTLDELFRDAAGPGSVTSPAAKEVLRCRLALRSGFDLSQQWSPNEAATFSSPAVLLVNTAGFRKLPGTTLKDGSGAVIYTPPQQHQEIVELMSDLEKYINSDSGLPDPLIRMALIHHQFESIDPSMTRSAERVRMINVLHLVKEQLLDIPGGVPMSLYPWHKNHILRARPSVREPMSGKLGYSTC